MNLKIKPPKKRLKIINADSSAWLNMRKKFKGLNDPEIIKVVDLMIDKDFIEGFKKKLRPELSDTQHDRTLKKITRKFCFKE